MTDLMRVRIQTHGPEYWQISVTDVETGQTLPVLWDEQHGIDLRNMAGVIVARVDLMVTEIDIENLHAYGSIARIVEREADPETVDDFAARTVSLVTRKDGG